MLEKIIKCEKKRESFCGWYFRDFNDVLGKEYFSFYCSVWKGLLGDYIYGVFRNNREVIIVVIEWKRE